MHGGVVASSTEEESLNETCQNDLSRPGNSTYTWHSCEQVSKSDHLEFQKTEQF